MKVATSEAYDLLHQGVISLAQVEANGVRIDTDYLDRTIKETGDKITSLQKEMRGDPIFHRWRKRFGEKTKMGSREQLGKLLFGEMGYESKGETATGKAKVDESAFDGIDLPFVKNFIRLEKLKKIQSTYLGGVLREVVDGYLHPVFNLHTVQTFRSSSSDPNFQNLPIRNPEFGGLIRRAFIPREGRVLVEIDYSGIEVRIAACYHQDPAMLEYIEDPSKDMHRDMAAECYMIDPKQVSKGARYCAKNMFVFPQFYGSFYVDCAKALWEAIDRMSLTLEGGIHTKIEGSGTHPKNMNEARQTSGPTPPYSLKQHLASKGIKKLGACDPSQKPLPGTFEHHIKQVEDRFWNKRFPTYAQWKKTWWNSYQKGGGFSTLTGFRIDGLYGRNDVINYPVQGSAFHCLLWSLIRIQSLLRKRKMQTLVVGQIHDSIIADVPVEELQDYLTLAKRVMTVSLPKVWKWIITPLDVEAEVTPVGGNWFEKKEWVEKNGLWVEKGKN